MFDFNNVRWRVLGVRWNHPALKNKDGSYAFGSCDNSNKVVYVVKGLSDRKLKKVLCHELVHAAMFSYNINLNYMEEEYVADLIATYGDEIIKKTNEIFSTMKKGGDS